MQTCLKCGYQRKSSDGAPDWQCPGCGVAYCKTTHSHTTQHSAVSVKVKAKKRSFGLWVILLMVVVAGVYWKTHRVKLPISAEVLPAAPISSNTAALSKEPVQTLVEGKIPAFKKNGYLITPLASFEIEAKVLSKENYWLGRTADLSPTDLALGWGVMATTEMLKKVRISQSNRWFYWRVDQDFTPALGQDISTHASNMHIIPATTAAKNALSAIKRGQIAYINGYLVEANASDGWKWRSSLSREDTGDGACELLLAYDLRVK